MTRLMRCSIASSTDVSYGHPELGLLQRIRDLLFGKAGLLHGLIPHQARGPSCRILYLSPALFSGGGSEKLVARIIVPQSGDLMRLI